MHSLYKKHPVGSLLVWVTGADAAPARGDGELAPGVVKLLLDGQQRITSMALFAISHRNFSKAISKLLADYTLIWTMKSLNFMLQ